MPASQVIIDRLDALLRQRPDLELLVRYTGQWRAELRQMSVHGIRLSFGAGVGATFGDALADVYDSYGRRMDGAGDVG